MLFKVKHFFNIISRLPLVQGVNYFNKVFCYKLKYAFVTKFLPVDFEVTLYNSVKISCQSYKFLP